MAYLLLDDSLIISELNMYIYTNKGTVCLSVCKHTRAHKEHHPHHTSSSSGINLENPSVREKHNLYILPDNPSVCE